MKTRTRLAPWPLSPSAVRTLGVTVGLACAGLMPARAPAQEVDIGVRSTVVDKELQWAHKTDSPESGGHSKTFALLAIDEVKAAESLVKPVDKDAIVGQLLHQLQVNGFHPYQKGTKPDILLTVSYGRGNMHNPYFRDQGELPSGFETLPVSYIPGAFMQQFIDQKTPGFEAKLQKAEFEKLFIRVTAWEYPKDSKAKARMLWKTIIVADDPDHRDLNAIAAQMLEAGAPYFDKQIKDREVEFYKPVPNGHVDVGPPQVVEPKSK